MEKQEVNDALISRIRKMNDEIKAKVPDVNCGGCGMFAILFYDAIRKNVKGAKIKIAVIDSSYERKAHYIKEVRSGNRDNARNLSANHFMIRLNNWLIDGKSVCDVCQSTDDIGGYYTRDDMRLAISYGSWNPEYNQTENKVLYQIVTKYFPFSPPAKKKAR